MHQATHIGHCSVTGKRQYLDRKTATKVVRRQHKRMSPYRCEHCGHWHAGHLSPDIIRGVITRTDIYQPVRHARNDDQDPELSRLDELRAARELIITGRRRIRGVSRDEAIARIDVEIGRVVAGVVGV